MFRQRRFSRICERLVAMLAGFAVSMTVSAAEPRARRQDKSQDIEMEASSADAREPRAADKRERKGLDPRQTRELQIAGGVFAGLGVAGLVVGIAGVALGATKQKEADEKRLPAQQQELDQLDKEGARANQMGLAGFIVGGGLVAVGVALLTAGAIVRKRENRDREARIRVTPMGFHRGSGLLLQGRF